MLTDKIRGIANDLSTLGKIGIVRALTGTIVVLGCLLVYQQVRFSDRWTKTDHQVYVKEHDENVDDIMTQYRGYKDNHDDDHDETWTKVMTALGEIKERLARIETRQKANGR